MHETISEPGTLNDRAAEVWYFPYLTGLDERAQIGRWELVPARSMDAADCLGGPLFEFVEGLDQLYEHRSDGAAYVRPIEGLIGNRLEKGDAWALRRAVCVAALDSNPLLDASDDERPNEGHVTVTSDSTVLFGHPFSPNGVAVTRGVLVEMKSGGYGAASEMKIQAPLELPYSLMPRRLDTEYAEALLGALQSDDQRGGRIFRAAEWLDVVWRNTESITTDTRLLAVHAGLEALTAPASGISTNENMRTELGTLLEPDNKTRTTRPYRTRTGQTLPTAMTDLEWWACRFGWLRNDLAHGVRPTVPDYRHEGRHHLWIGERHLRAALKELVIAVTGKHGLRDDPRWRFLNEL